MCMTPDCELITTQGFHMHDTKNVISLRRVHEVQDHELSPHFAPGAVECYRQKLTRWEAALLIVGYMLSAAGTIGALIYGLEAVDWASLAQLLGGKQ